LLGEVETRLKEAPWFVPTMPRTGKPLSVRMTNFGPLGWVTDRVGGYRYQPAHPATGRPWPAIPPALIDLWRSLTAYPDPPEACLVNHYQGASKLGSHVDSDEPNRHAPVLSISLGDDAVFHIGGLRRGDRKVRITLKSGDVVILGGAARSVYHGVDRVLAGSSNLITCGGRINLTLRRVNV
jgi:alkylated DNA repair protein (DNA oxidative demethylase)